MITASGLVLAGLILLTWSADRLVYGSAAIARNFGISPLVIGMTIIAMGSSAPEMMVSATASLLGHPDTAVGNVLGSNITNIALVLGVAACIRALHIQSILLKRELPLLLLVTLLGSWVLSDRFLSRTEGIALLIGFFALILLLLKLALSNKDQQDPMVSEHESEVPDGVSNLAAWIWTLVGLILLPLSAQLLVIGATDIAHYFGVSDLVIGLTIVAIGTSLPELAATVASVAKGEDEMALGNIVGSNLFNILAVLGIAGSIEPATLDQNAGGRDMYVMLGLTLALLASAYAMRNGKRMIYRWQGVLFLICFIAYQAMLLASNLPL